MKKITQLLLTTSLILPAFLPSLLHADDTTPSEVHNLVVNPATPGSNTGITTVNLTPASPSIPGYTGVITSPPNTVSSGTLIINVSPKLVKAAYLGVSISPTDQTLQAQLKLTPGSGLVINNIDDKSPAETAGLQPNDIITLFADQIVINPEQFEVLVRSHKPGDTIDLTIIRQAQPQKISVTLTEKEQPELTWLLNSHQPNSFSTQPYVISSGGVSFKKPLSGTLQFPAPATSQGYLFQQAPQATIHFQAPPPPDPKPNP